jgi:hypothetical protein
MPINNTMKEAVETQYGASLDEQMPKLIDQYRSTVKVAARLGVAPNAVRHWLLQNGYRFDGRDWVKPEPEHAD